MKAELSRQAKVEMLRLHHMYRSAVSRDAEHYEVWIQCACGFKGKLPGAGNIPDVERAKLNHLLDVLEGKHP